jgi:predicted nucleotidyltransferase
MTDELAQRVKQAAQVLIAAGAREVFLFGSAATGSIRKGSDIDLAVTGLPPEVFFLAMGEAGDILQHSLDLVDLDEDNPFTRYLKEEGELVRVS